MKEYEVTRQQIVEAARSLLGVRYMHQGRNPALALDCVGFLKAVGVLMNYPWQIDMEGYRRTTDYATLYGLLCEVLIEIPVSEVKAGDFYFLLMGAKNRPHVAVRTSDELDLSKGVTPMLAHANGSVGRVVEQPVSLFEKNLTFGFRAKGLTD